MEATALVGRLWTYKRSFVVGKEGTRAPHPLWLFEAPLPEELTDFWGERWPCAQL